MTAGRPAVLFIAPQPFFQARGTPIRVRFDVQALAELGFAVDLLTLPCGEDVAIPGVRIVRAANPFALADMPIGPSFWKAVYDLILFWHAWRLAAQNSYQVVHCIEDAGVIGLVLQRVRRCSLVYEKHSDPASYEGGLLRNLMMLLYRKVEAQVIRQAAAVVTGPALAPLTRAIADHERVYGICSTPSTIREADPQATAAIRRRLQRADGDVLVTYIGSFAAYQGIELMFQAIPLVVREQPEARFVVIGGAADEVERWRRWLAGENAGAAVLFIPHVAPDDVPDYLAASDVLLSPRLAGSNPPLKHLDYLKANRAIVATDTAGNRFYLDPTVALLTAARAPDFAAGIVQLVADPELRSDLAGNGRRRIEGSYSYPELKRGLQACYADLQRRLAAERGDRLRPGRSTT